MTVNQFVDMFYNECKFDVCNVFNEHIIDVVKSATCISYENVNRELNFSATKVLKLLDVEKVCIKSNELVKLYIDTEELYKDTEE